MKKSNGQGSISYEAERKQYRAAITDTQGKRIRKRFDTKQEAEEWLTLIRADIYKNDYIPKSNYTLGEWMIEHMDVYCRQNVKPTTFRAYQYALNGIDSIADIPLEELTPHCMQKFFHNNYQHRKTSGKQLYSILLKALKRAESLALIKKNPLQGVEIPNPKKKEREAFTVAEVNTIIEFIKSRRYERHYEDMVVLAINTGMRIGEILALQYDCVFPDHIEVKRNYTKVNGVDFLDEPKSESSKRSIAITSGVYDMLMKRETFSEFIFSKQDGNPIKEADVFMMWKKTLTRLEIPYRPFHYLRHTHATLLISNGVSIMDVSKRLGHASAATTMRVYAHAIPGEDKKIADKIADILTVAPTLPPI